MPVTVKMEDDIVVIELVGALDYEAIMLLGDDIAAYAVRGVLPLVLVDLTLQGYADLGARRAAFKVASRFYYRRVGVVRSATGLNNALVRFIAHQSGHVHQIETFPAKAEALRWLHGSYAYTKHE